MVYGFEHLLIEGLRTRTGQVIGSTVSCVAMTMAALFVAPMGVRQVRLALDWSRTSAAVVETKIFYGKANPTKPVRAAVRYTFAVGGATFRYRDLDGSEWAIISIDRQAQTARDRIIDVAYHPADPSINAPIDDMRWLWAWGTTVAVVPTGLAALTWVWVTRVFRRRTVAIRAIPAADSR